MFKFITMVFSVFCLSVSFAFGAVKNESSGPPPRTDKFDDTSANALSKLQRVRNILATLVPDPQSYHLILSNNNYFGGEAFPPYALSDKPTIVIYEGALSPNQSHNELVFMIAHELGHLNLHHCEKMNQRMEKIFTGPPIGISGTVFNVFYQKIQEREADHFGLQLYKKAGYDMTFFQSKLDRILDHRYASQQPKKVLPSLSMKDSHFSMKERFELLTHDAYTLT